MGACACLGNAEFTNTMIERHMNVDQLEDFRIHKLLLLGPGNSGKSTFLKQLRESHGTPLSVEEIEDHKVTIQRMLVEQMKKLISKSEKFAEHPQGKYDHCRMSDDDETQRCARIVKDTDTNELMIVLRSHTVEAIRVLWADNGIRETWKYRGDKFSLEDCAHYYFTDIDRVTHPDFEPTQDDILRVRLRTTGVHSSRITVGKETFEMIDVGGQRSERRKWIDIFDNATAVCYVCALSGCWELLFEDEATNGMSEALRLFEEILQLPYFMRAEIIMFLNKTDIFETRMRCGKKLSSCFPQYPKSKEFNPPEELLPLSADMNEWPEAVREEFADACNYAKQFIRAEFNKLFRFEEKECFAHFTCAIDPKNVEDVIWDVQNIVVRSNLRSAKLI